MEVKNGEERHACEHGKDKDSGVGTNLALLKKSGKDSCAVCLTGMGRNAIFCGGCLLYTWYQGHTLPRPSGFGAPDAWAMLGQLMED